MNSFQKLNVEIDYSDPYTVISLINKALFYSLGGNDIAYFSEFIDVDNDKHHQYVTIGNGVPFIIFDLYEHGSEVVVKELRIQRSGTICKIKE